MENEIVRKTTSLTLIAIMVAGGMTFAIPGVMPSAYAQVNEMSVSAANPMFENTFAGAQVVEVSVNAPQFRAESASDRPYAPAVSVDDNPLVMQLARNGVWYGYFVDTQMAEAAVSSGSMNFGMSVDPNTYMADVDGSGGDGEVLFNSKADALYVGGDVLINSDHTDPIIQAFDFTEASDIDIELENGSNSEAVTLAFDTVEDYASLMLDRDTYPLEAHIHIAITDTWLNIDPTAEDTWLFDTNTGDIYRLSDDLVDEINDELTTVDSLTPIPKGDLMCDDNCEFTINTGQQGDDVLSSTGNADSPMGLDNMLLTFTETNDNTGMFTNTDSDDAANLITTSDDEMRGKTAVIDYNDGDTDVVIGFDFATVDIQPADDTWNSGEEIAVIITDQDANKNGMLDEDMLINDANVDIIPALMTGSPVVITDGTTINGVDADDMAYDSFAHRVIIDEMVDVGDTLTIVFEDDIDLPTEDTVYNYINYDISSLGTATSVSACEGMDMNTITGVSGDAVYTAINEDEVNGCATITFELAESVDAGEYPIVVDFMSFGFTDDGVQGHERIADQIVRIEAEETDDNSGVFEGSLEYIMVNQLNIRMQETFDSVSPNSDAPVFIVIEDLTDEDAPKVSYLDVGADGVATQVSDRQEAPSHSGVVTFDSSRYKVADTVTITLDDADLNVDSGIVEVYTIDSEIGFVGEVIGGEAVVVLDVTFDDRPWKTPSEDGLEGLCLNDLEGITDDTGLDATKFTMVETSKDSGVFTGSFQIPSDWCRPGSERTETTTGLDIEVNYLDFRDASGEVIEVGDSSAVGANTGSVAFDRTVYPVPFGEPRDFSNVGDLQENHDIALKYDQLRDLKRMVDASNDEITTPSEFKADNLAGDDTMTRLFDATRGDTLTEKSNDLDAQIDELSDMLPEDSLSDIASDLARAKSDLADIEQDGANPDGYSYFPVHSTAFDADTGIAYVPNGDLSIHVRVTDADYDVSASGQDTISGSGDGPITVFVNRGSDTCIIATAGGDSGVRNSERGCNDEYMRYGSVQEIAPDAGVFEVDITVRYDDGPDDERCPVRGDGCILQGDIIQVEYADRIDASGDRNTVTDSATFDLRNAVLQSDKNSYLIGTDMILTLIEPDFDLDNDQAETYTLDLIEWDSDAATVTMGKRGGEAGSFDPEPDALRETGDSTGIFQTIVEIPEELDDDRLERDEVIVLEYTDWDPLVLTMWVTRTRM